MNGRTVMIKKYKKVTDRHSHNAKCNNNGHPYCRIVCDIGSSKNNKTGTLLSSGKMDIRLAFFPSLLPKFAFKEAKQRGSLNTVRKTRLKKTKP